MTWTSYLCEVTTGRMIAELPLTQVKATTHLDLGAFSAVLPLTVARQQASAAARFAAARPVLRQILEASSPGKYSVVLDQNGAPRGEWIIWQRQRSASAAAESVSLAGTEFGSILGQRLMPQNGRRYTGVDQLEIASDLILSTLRTPAVGAITISDPPATSSGVLRDRVYDPRDSTSVLQRVRELSDVVDGFEWTIQLAWAASGPMRIVRTLVLHYPRAGREQPIILDRPGPGGPPGAGNVVSVSMTEDATRLASRVYAFGAGEGPTKVVGVAESTALTDLGYPTLDRSVSFLSVNRQQTIDGHAAAGLRDAQSAKLAPTIRIRADRDPLLGDWQLGDRMLLKVEPSPAWPDGLDGWVRAVGWTFNPGTSPELVDLSITAESGVF